ncbi:MAG: MarR family transcriptional regulator [Thermoproteota archaeon]|nr:hypothetical protein [Candidatus Brockarchaeota archaeon]
MLQKSISRFVSIVVLLITIIILREPLSIRGEFEFQTTYRIILHEDSSATWIVKLSTPLLSEEDKKDFEEFMKNADRESMLSSFKSTIENIVNRASLITGRPMLPKDFNLEIDFGGGIIKQLGIIEYRFTWVGFSLKTLDKIEVGDVFEGGFYLFSDEVLEIDYSELAENYFLEMVSPHPSKEESSKVTWFGKLDFSDCEPRLVFQNRVLTVEEFLLNNTRVEKGLSLRAYGKISPPVSNLIIHIVYKNPEGLEIVRMVTVGSDGYFSDDYTPNLVGSWSVSLRLPSNSKYKINNLPQHIIFSVYEEAESTEGSETYRLLIIIAVLMVITLVSASLILYRRRKKPSLPSDEYMISDEELVLRILKNSGGRLLQKQIKEATGFSKAKTSMVLNELQKKGLIRKIKRGREYLVELA